MKLQTRTKGSKFKLKTSNFVPSSIRQSTVIMQPFNHPLCKPINYSLQSISGMLLEAETKLRLRYFISTLVNSGLHCLGPQCNFICEGFEGRCDIIPSKCIVDVLEVKYGAKSPYAPALVDFVSSHQGIHGTVRPICFNYFSYLVWSTNDRYLII